MSDINPKKRFFLQVYDNNLNGTLDLDDEVPQGFGSLDDALKFAKGDAVENKGNSFLYECKPLYHVTHKGTAKVKKL